MIRPYAWAADGQRGQFEEWLHARGRTRHNAGLFSEEVGDGGTAYTTQTTAVYPGDKNHLPYDVVVQTIRTGEPEQPGPGPSMPPAGNFHITDDHLGEGGPKEKYRRNVEAIRTLKAIELEGRGATEAEQEVLSRYVGWGGLPQVFDQDKEDWHRICRAEGAAGRERIRRRPVLHPERPLYQSNRYQGGL